jgi:hypothetical protein
MKAIVVSVLAVWVCLPASWAPTAWAQNINGNLLDARGNDARNFIVQMYSRYYGRSPSNREVDVWMQGIRRGDSLLDVHAAFIASDEYFANRGNNESEWIIGMYFANMGRAPQQNELRFWVDRYRNLRQNSRAVAQEFLQSIGGETGPVIGWPTNPGNNNNGGINNGQLQSLGNQLTTNSQLLVQSVRNETSGLTGGLARIQANNLLSAAQNSRNAFAAANRDPQAAWSAHRSLDSSIQGLANSLRNEFNANNSRYYLTQVTQVHRAIGDLLPSGNIQPPGPIYPPYFPPTDQYTLSRSDARQLGRLNDATTRQFQNIYSLVQNISYQDYRYRQLATDLGTVTGQFQYLSTQIREGYPATQLRSDVARVDGEVRNLGERIRVGNVDLRVSQAWFDCIRSYEDLAVAVNRLQSNSGGGGLPGNAWNLQTTLRWIDQSIDQCDALIRQYGHYYLNGSGYSRFLTQLRNLKNSLVILKMHLSQNADNATLAADWQTVRDNFESARSLFPSNTTFSRSTDSTPFSDLEQSMQQLDLQFGNLGG